jgi:hypothetical protein
MVCYLVKGSIYFSFRIGYEKIGGSGPNWGVLWCCSKHVSCVFYWPRKGMIKMETKMNVESEIREKEGRKKEKCCETPACTPLAVIWGVTPARINSNVTSSNRFACFESGRLSNFISLSSLALKISFSGFANGGITLKLILTLEISTTFFASPKVEQFGPCREYMGADWVRKELLGVRASLETWKPHIVWVVWLRLRIR